MFYPVDSKEKDWSKFTLILPTVSVGNVAQLAVDLIVSSLSLTRVGYVLHESILPMCGNNPFATNRDAACKLGTSCEVFESKSLKIVVIQQRSPFVKGRKKIFVKWLADWIREKKFSRVVIMTSSFAEERVDKQMQGSQLQYLANQTMKSQEDNVFSDKLHWQELELRSLPPGLGSENGETPTLYIPGSGIAKTLFEDLSDMSVVMLLMFCSDGDNTADAVALANYLNSWMKLITFESESEKSNKPSSWKIPMSWRLVYGSSFDQTLFH